MGLRILIVEDDKHIRKIFGALLRLDPQLAARKPEVVFAADGKEALPLLDSGPFDLVISDLLMPRMDGFTFTRELRKHKDGGKASLFVISAVYKDPAIVNRLHAEVNARFFAKPFQVRDVLTAIKKVLAIEVPPPREPTRAVPSPSFSPPAGTSTPAAVEAPKPAAPTSGSLAIRPPPRLLLELFEQQATGTLSFLRGKVRKEIVLMHGSPTNAQSNLRNETLGHFLVSAGVLDDKRHQEALARAESAHERLGQVLLELGWLSESELLKQLRAQMRAKITGVLRWSDGDWQFAPGSPPPEKLLTPVETPRLVFTGLQKTAHVDQIAQLMAQVSGQLVPTPRAERHREPFARVFGGDGLAALQRRTQINELVKGKDPAPMLVQIEALLVCGMAEIEAALEASPTPRKPLPTREREQPAGGDAERKPRAQALYDQLFSEEPSQVDDFAPRSAIEELEHDEPSGIMKLPRELSEPPAGAPVPPASSDGRAVEALRKEVLSYYLSIQGRDHYQVLGVARGATPAEIAAAYAALDKRFRLERFADIDLGADYVRVEEIRELVRGAFETLFSRDGRAAYDRKLAAARPSTSMQAELLAQRAETLIRQGDPAGALGLLERAAAAQPEQADYRALLGWAIFQAHGEVARAKAHLQAALDLDPDLVDAHDFAGRIAVAEGDDARAIAHLERVLEADPTRTEALPALEAALARRGDHRRLEQQYRSLIQRLGAAHDPERARLLWWRLAELYRMRIGDREAARAAYETAARLQPDDPRPREALARLYAEEPQRWRETAQALRDSWRLAPDDPAPGRALFALHHDGERWDAAYVMAAALALRGAGNPQSEEFRQRHRRRFLARAWAPLDATLLDRIRHADDDRDLGQLFIRLFTALPSPFGQPDLGVTPEDSVAAVSLPAPFARVLQYVAGALEVAVPAVYRRANFGGDVHVGGGRPPLLLAGPQALASQDKLMLAFRIGRALTYLLPGRAAAGALPSRQLRQLVQAALGLALPSLRGDDDSEVARLRTQLTGAAPALGRELAPIVERLRKGPQATVNLARYTRGMARTADRVGLLLCNDLQTAVHAVVDSGAPGAENDLVDFASSDEYLEARDALGLSLAV
jgi:CheY-like chemotaxis protein/tetratricopeptide (TPR) repeat protein